jgi:surface carbohydrate biosynthesis protein
VILFPDTAEEIRSYFPEATCWVWDPTSNLRYVRILIRLWSVFRFGLSDYIAEVVNQSGARLILSAQDNFLPFFKIRQRLLVAELVLIQNGVRTPENDLEQLLARDNSKKHVGVYMVFTQAISERLQQRVSGKFLPIGSFRSNHVRKVNCEGRISYISTYNPEVSLAKVIGVHHRDGPITYRRILQFRLAVVQQLVNFSQQIGVRLTILGKRTPPGSELEELFYHHNLPKGSFIFLPRLTLATHYQNCDRSRLVVSTSSTLGYESLGRGIRTAMFYGDGTLLGNPTLLLGWPANIASEGSFWSSNSDTRRVVEILDHLWKLDDDDWRRELRSLSAAFPRHDEGNVRFCEELREFGAHSPFAPPNVT